VPFSRTLSDTESESDSDSDSPAADLVSEPPGLPHIFFTMTNTVLRPGDSDHVDSDRLGLT
jgi:hypothetical protein